MQHPCAADAIILHQFEVLVEVMSVGGVSDVVLAVLVAVLVVLVLVVAVLAVVVVLVVLAVVLAVVIVGGIVLLTLIFDSNVFNTLASCDTNSCNHLIVYNAGINIRSS